MKPDGNADFMEMTEVNGRVLGRVYMGEKAKRFILYPDDQFRKFWDMLSTLYANNLTY